MTLGSAVEATCRYTGHYVQSLVLLTYFMEYTYNLYYLCDSATFINVGVFVYRLECFSTLTVAASIAFLRNITGVVVTYAARWLYAYPSRSGMTVATTVVIWQIFRDSIPAVGQLLGPFIPVHCSLGSFLILYCLVNPSQSHQRSTALRCDYFSPT